MIRKEEWYLCKFACDLVGKSSVVRVLLEKVPGAADGGLLPRVAVVGAQEPFKFWRQVTRHLQAADVAESAQSQAHRELVPTI